MVYSSSTPAEKKMATENPDDIVISGMSIRCSQSDNVEEFAKNLYDGVNMVHENLQRCDEDHFGVPKQHGFIKDIRKFDATFFNVHPKQAEGMDPQLRILHEVAYESIIDGGVDPAELKNSNTGVFIGTSNSDAREAWTSADVSEIDGYSLIGTHRAFLANRLSFTFDLRGPSFGVDAACATSGVAINQGYLHIKHGVCDAALVGGVSLVYQPKVSYQILKLGLLCKDGMCKVFDEAADGYVRAEAIVCLLLQKRKNAKRIYATLVHSKINNDGFKEQGITFPCTESQGQLVAEVYAEAGVDPEDVEYVEAHGTGTKIGDPQETNGIALGFSGTRTKPLPIGAVKSNMGHSEHASGAVSVVKILIAMQSGVIPPNLHFKTPNPLIPALVDGRLKVVTEPMKWNSTLAGVNCFGFGGQNSHLILRGNPNIRQEAVTDVRLFLYMGRTEEAARNALDYANRYPDDPYVPYLLMQSAYAKPASMPFRGYTITNSAQAVTVVERVSVEQKPVWWIFSGQGTQWAAMGKDMMRLEAFRSVTEKCAQALIPFGLDLIKILMSSIDEDFTDPTISFVAIAAIQVALVELLRTMEISPQGFIGHSAGEIGCAYADGCFSIKEAMLAAYWRGQAVQKAQLLPGAMAAVGLSWEKATQLCSKYSDVTPACDNADDNVTVSGSAAELTRLVADLKPQNIFAKEVNSYGVAFHSPAMQKAAPIYLDALKNVLTSPKMRTTRWLSTAVSEDQWTSNLAKYASAEYFAHNLTSTVKFNDALKKVPANAIAIEIAPHGLLQALIRKTVGDRSTPVALMKRVAPDNSIHFLESIGKLYALGLNPRVLNIFPKPSLPAPRDTPFLGSVVQWDHSASWRIPHFTDFIHKGGKSSQYNSVCDLSDPLNEYFLENIINNQPRYSAGGFLALVAKAYAGESGNTVEKCPRLLFSELEFLAPVALEKDKKLQFGISVTRKTGYFEITIDSETVVTGFVSALATTTPAIGSLNADERCLEKSLSFTSVYEEFQFRGYGYGSQCQMIRFATVDGTAAQLQCPSYETAIDGLLQLAAFNDSSRSLVIPRKIRSVRVDIPITAAAVQKTSGSEARIISNLDLATTVGLEIEGVTWEQVQVEPTTAASSSILREVRFVPFQSKVAATVAPSVSSSAVKNLKSQEEVLCQETVGPLIELAVQNSIVNEIRIVELVKGDQLLTSANIVQSCQIPSHVKIQYSNFLLKSGENTEIEHGSATILILRNYFNVSSNVTKDLTAVASLIQEDGFLLIIQQAAHINTQFHEALSKNNFNSLSELSDGGKNYFVLGRKILDENSRKNPRLILSWNPAATDDENIRRLRASAADANTAADSSAQTWLVAPPHRTDLVDTILKLKTEYPDAGLRLIVNDSAEPTNQPEFDANHAFYAEIVSRDLVINVYKNGKWGTFLSVPIERHYQQGDNGVGTTSNSTSNYFNHAAYALLVQARAVAGQTILINVDAEVSELEDVLKVAKKIGLTIHMIGLNNKEHTKMFARLSIPNSHFYVGALSNVAVAQNVLIETEGRGVDIVYNLTKTSKLRESLRVMTSSGASYIESQAAELDNSSLHWAISKNVTVFQVDRKTLPISKLASDFVTASIADGTFAPPTFSNNQGNKNTGSLQHSNTLLQSKKHYVVVAGMNENVGIKLSYWLASQGAENIHLHVTTKPTQVLQSQLKYFEPLHAKLTVWSSAVAAVHSVEHTIRTLTEDGGIGGIFVLQSLVYAADTNDSLSPQLLDASSSVDILDKLTRTGKTGSTIEQFVVLTSGTTTTSTSNDLANIKHVIDRRNLAGLPGLFLNVSILVSTSEAAISFTEFHPEENFISLNYSFDALKTALLRGCKGVLAVVPEGKPTSRGLMSSFDEEAGPQDKSYLPQAVAKIMGIKDFASLDMFLSLGDYGIDSLMAMELGRILERDFTLSLTLQEIRSLCIRDICLMSGATNAVEAAKLSEVRSEFEKPVLLDTVQKHYNLGELVPKAALVLLRQVKEIPEILFIVHPMEGSVSPVLATLSNHLQVTTYGLNCTANMNLTSMSTLAASYIKEIKQVQPTGPYNLGGYSFGAGVAFEMALQLQSKNKDDVRNLVLLDGSHSFVAAFTKGMKSGYTVNPNMPLEEMEARKQSAFETAILTLFVTQLVKTKRKQLTDNLSAANNFDERVDVAVQELQRCSALQDLGKDVLRDATISFAQRLKIADVYKPDTKFTGQITLIKCSEKMIRNLGEFYELDKVCTGKDTIRAVTVPGNHEGFVVGESARITAKYVNDALLGAATI